MSLRLKIPPKPYRFIHYRNVTTELANLEVAGTAKLQLDEENGELVSKNELKRRLQKRAKKAAQVSLRQPQAPKESNTDPDAMFKQGFLAAVYQERPVKPVITRLHLGHAKAIAVNFGFARYHGGQTLRPSA